jgi:hypothetical protein
MLIRAIILQRMETIAGQFAKFVQRLRRVEKLHSTLGALLHLGGQFFSATIARPDAFGFGVYEGLDHSQPQKNRSDPRLDL